MAKLYKIISGSFSQDGNTLTVGDTLSLEDDVAARFAARIEPVKEAKSSSKPSTSGQDGSQSKE